MAVVGSAALSSVAAAAPAVVSGSAGTAAFGGSLRTIPAWVEGTPAGVGSFAIDETLARATAKLESSSGTFLFETHLVEEVFVAEDSVAGLSLNGATEPVRYRAARLGWTEIDRPGTHAAASFDRLSLRLRLPRVDVTVGRQAVNFSEAYFWNPLDVFLPFDARAFDRDYKPGVDAARVQVSVGEVSGFDVVAAAGPRVSLGADGTLARDGAAVDRRGSALMGRAFTDLGHVDVVVQGGKVYGGALAGAGFAGEVAGVGLRGEATWFAADDSTRVTILSPQGAPEEVPIFVSHASVVAGADHRFDSGFYVAGEYFFNGAGDDRDAGAGWIRALAGSAPDAARNLAGVLFRDDVTPLVTVSMAAIGAPFDRSAVLAPSVSVSLGENADLLAGALAVTGRRAREIAPGVALPRSEFGSAPGAAWAELKLYF